MNNIIEEEVGDIKNIFKRFRRKDFSGTTGQVMKNSTYQLTTNLIAKFGSLIFTIVVARMLGVELFGLYTLALSTIILFASFSDLGISTAMITFASKALGENKPGKAKTYFKGLLKYKIYLVIICSLVLVVLGYFLANNYYNKPIFYALLAGAIYIPIVTLAGYVGSAFQAGNNFKIIMIKEIIFQILRFTLIPITILLLLKTNLEASVVIAIVILVITLAYFLGLLYLRIVAKKEISFLRKTAKGLTRNEKIELGKFVLPLSVMALSGMFFGYIDILMLGHYVDLIYIGYYGAAFGLIGAAGLIISSAAVAVLPVFARTQGRSLESLFSKTRNFTFVVGLVAALFTFFAAKYILMIYGKDFMQATIFLQLFSLILIIMPVAAIYNSYFVSIKKTKIIAKLLIISTVVNVILNIWFIGYGLQFGMMEGVLGACVATICSRVIYLAGFIISKRMN
jgi:O-antigen/teichoic acid export membrane protein